MIRWAVAWGPAAAWAAFLFFMSSRTSLPVDLVSGTDKIAHFAAYAVLGLLLAYGAGVLGRSPLVAVALGWLYGALDEFHQSFVPGRAAEFGDWVADAFGTLAGVGLFLLVARRRRVPSNPTAADPAETTTP